MGLSLDLIAQFAKISTPEKKNKSEVTVYGTTVSKDGKMYVKLDGSEILTPVYTTVNTKANERVTVMIKNHTATITGNITSPSARTGDLEEVSSSTNESVSNLQAEIDELKSSSILQDISQLQEDVGNINEQLETNTSSISDLKIIVDGKASNEDLVNEIARLEELVVQLTERISVLEGTGGTEGV